MKSWQHYPTWFVKEFFDRMKHKFRELVFVSVDSFVITLYTLPTRFLGEKRFY